MIVTNLLGFAVIGLIAWWFWFYKPADVPSRDSDIVVTVDSGSYTPSHFTLNARTPAKLRFLRKDPSPCAEVVIFPRLDIAEALPVNKTISIDLPALEPGEYRFHCQMQMYRGVITVE